MPSQNSVLAARPANPHAGIGDKIRGAMAVGKTRWGMLALVFFATTLNYIDRAALGDPGQRNELDGDGLRQHQLLVPGRLRDWLCAARPTDRPRRCQARVLLRGAAVERGHRRPWPGHLGRRLHGLPLHPRADRGRQLPGLRQDHPPVVPCRRARSGHRHLQRWHQRRRDDDADAAAVDSACVGLASGVPVHVGTRWDLAAVLGLEVLQPGRASDG